MTRPPHLSPDSLLAHEPFVRAVVRDLLRDEQHVQDVLQETWMRALDRGPRETGSLRGWLARVARRLALDQHRGNARRQRRERETARSEALESVEVLHARLEAQREVVDAVLALEEPYKSVVLLAYYEELAPQEIGARLGRSAATVRSQLSRAHEILRHRLDAHHGGDRSAWAGILVPWALATKSKTGVLVAAGIGVALLGAGVWVLPRILCGSSSSMPPVAFALPPAPEARPDALAAGAPVSAREAVPEASDGNQARTKPELKTLDVLALRDLAVQAMRTLEAKVLTPEPHWLEQHKRLLALPDTGITKIVMRTQNGYPYDGLVFPRFGGSYFSFATLTHDYDQEPDLGYEQGQLCAGFYGGMVGMLVQVGDADLTTFAPRADVLPPSLPAARRPAWELLFVRPDTDDLAGARKLQQQESELRLSRAPAREGQTYLLRVWSPEEHDHLVALRVLARDSECVTIAWRVLQRFEHAGEKRPRGTKPDYAEVPPAPAWMAALEAPKLVDLIRELRRTAQPELLDVPTALRSEQAWRLPAGSASGWFRLLPEARFAPLLDVPGGGAYYSFEQRANTTNDEELSFVDGRLQARFLVDLGAIGRAEYERAAQGVPPPGLDATLAEAWEILWNATSSPRGSDGVSDRGFDPGIEQRLRLPASPKAAEGHAYLLRAIGSSDGSDHLVLLSALATSTDGVSLCWRELKRFDR